MRVGKHFVNNYTSDSWSERGHLDRKNKTNFTISTGSLRDINRELIGAPRGQNLRRWILSTLQLFSYSKRGWYVPPLVSQTCQSLAEQRELTWITSENVGSFNLTLVHSRSPVPTAADAACCAASWIGSEMKTELRVSYHSEALNGRGRVK